MAASSKRVLIVDDDATIRALLGLVVPDQGRVPFAGAQICDRTFAVAAAISALNVGAPVWSRTILNSSFSVAKRRTVNKKLRPSRA